MRRKQTAVRFSESDERLIDALKAKTGIRTMAQLIVTALYEMAARLGVSVESEKE